MMLFIGIINFEAVSLTSFLEVVAADTCETLLVSTFSLLTSADGPGIPLSELSM